MQFQFRTRPTLGAWLALFLVLAILIAIAFVIATVAVGVFLFLLPVMVILGVVYYFFPGLRPRPPGGAARGDGIIDAEFRVVTPDEEDNDPNAPRIGRPGR